MSDQIDHLIRAPRTGRICGWPGCSRKADSFARCPRCRAVIDRCCYCGSAWAARDQHCQRA